MSHAKHRRRLNETRYGITQKAYIAGMEYYATVNFFDDTADPGEVFIKVAKEGSIISGLMDALCITISIALQHGVKWDVLGHKYLSTIFEPRDEQSSSIVDGVSKTISNVVQIRKELINHEH